MPNEQAIESISNRCITSKCLHQGLRCGLKTVFWTFLLLVLADIPVAIASDLMLHYDFDGSDPLTVKDRSGNGVDAIFDGFSALVTMGPRSQVALGVSSSKNDRSFDNRSATGMGWKGTGGSLRSGRFNPGQLDSFTIAGWFKTEGNVWLDHLARIISIRGKQHLLLMAVNGQLIFKIGRSSFMSAAAYHETSKWVFFAVAYDGTLPPIGNNVRFYVGSKTEPVRLVNQGSLLPPLGAWTVSERNSEIAWGNGVGKKSVGNRPLDGYMDDLRIYGTRKGRDGALSRERLEQIRRSALRSP